MNPIVIATMKGIGKTMKCKNCETKFNADERDDCPLCGTVVGSVECPDCQMVYDPAFYGEDNCPGCHGN